MKKTIYIFGLALTLLLFSACGKKGNTEEIELPSLTNVKTTSLPRNPIEDNSHDKAETENENLRPVIVTILENGLLSRGAMARIEYYGTKPSDLTAKTDKYGTAKILIPEKLSSFFLSAVKEGYATILFYTNCLVKGVTPVHVELNLDEPGSVITAQLLADKEIDENNISARLVHDDYKMGNYLRVATSTSCEGNKIIFPPVKELKGVKVMVKAKGFADSYSEPFNVRSGEDKTVDVKLLSDIKFRGKAMRSDGVVISNLHFQATPRGLYEEQNNPGHVGINKDTDKDGYFNVDGLLPEHYRLYLRTEEAQWVITNVILFSDEENYMEFIFPKFKYKNVNGIVIYEQSGEPAAGIEIKCYTYNLGRMEFKTTTDENGKFNVSLLVIDHCRAELVINEPGFAMITYQVRREIDKFITLLLRETGILTGRVATKSGKPISGVRVMISPEYNSSESSATRKMRWDENAAYRTEGVNRSDSDGIYVISNAAAPQAYSVNAWIDKDYFLQANFDRKVKIEQGKTTVYNVIMIQRPVVMVQLKDDKGAAVLKYSLRASTENERGTGGRTHSVKLYDKEDWHRFNILRHTKAKLSLRAESEDRRVAEKKNITVEPGKIYKITLHLSNSVPPTVSGFVYNSDMTPRIDSYIRADANKQRVGGRCDHLGFFEILGMEVRKGAKLKLSISYENARSTTNVLAGDNNIEWILPELKRIRGRVCIENNYSPATNFAVSIMGISNKKDFCSESGQFSLPLQNYIVREYSKIKFYVFVPGYAPEIKEFELDDSNPIDIGDIIVKNKPATITGRVIDHEYNPVNARLTLTKKDEKNRGFSLHDVNDKTDGSFDFSDLPPGNYIVKAHTQLKNLKSELFELRSGEIYTVPDLMVVETNAVLVLFKFVLPDGSPAANERISYFYKRIDKNGYIEEKIRPGIYINWKTKIEDKLYYTDKIVIKKGTEEVTVNLIKIPDITGTVTLGGKPLDNTKLSFQGDGNYYQSYAYDGKFEMEAKPGKYTVICSDKKTAASVELSESGPNKISFKSGNSTFEFVYPVEGNWGINLAPKVGYRYVTILSLSSNEGDNDKITELPAGEYDINAYCRNESFRTSITVRATLQPNETKKVVF